ncbi:MAG: WecB/TagA/CpsF family glycosyltransferase [Bacteroidales bacterium]|nr:WecB/TagA/CpsF family glycosyltransferase [Bacteroidales bacterium]MDE7466695.1 WecB/TagA/CpsF family glycosyltransferase [Muribaculaceae bacterium]
MNNRLFVNKLSEAASRYPDATFSRRGQIYTCVNPFSYHLIRKGHIPYQEIDGLYVDGILMQKLVNLLWKTDILRLSFDMTGMAPDLFTRLQSSDESIFFIGARHEEISASVDTIMKAYPGINLAGFRHGYFDSPQEREHEIRNIIAANPDFVIIGMGAPIQEHFLIDLKKAGFKGIAFTCGGFLHQTANRINYYPDWVNRYNLRAFYRLFHEKNLFKRLYNVLLQFPILFTLDTIRTRLSRP